MWVRGLNLLSNQRMEPRVIIKAILQQHWKITIDGLNLNNLHNTNFYSLLTHILFWLLFSESENWCTGSWTSILIGSSEAKIVMSSRERGKEFCCCIRCRHLNKLLADKITHSFANMAFFKDIGHERPIFTDAAVTKGLSNLSQKSKMAACYSHLALSFLLPWKQQLIKWWLLLYKLIYVGQALIACQRGCANS